MLLTAWMDANVYNEGQTEFGGSLDRIAAFEFGEEYVIRLYSGVTVEFVNLEDMLSILRDEFIASGSAYPQMQIEGDPIPKKIYRKAESPPADARRLVCSAAVGYPLQGRRAYIESFVSKVRNAVTLYNLTQSWDQFTQGNL